jgi:hypothetical protein
VTWSPINLDSLEERPKTQPTIGGVGLVYPGKRHLFSGPQESGKTMAAYAIALEEVRAKGSVVLIDLEMGQWDARDRFREMGATDADFARIFYVEPETEAGDDTMLGLLEWKPTLAIIDAAAGAYAIQNLDDNKRRDAELFANLWVRPFWQNDVATITIDHVVKNTDNRGKYAIGSERKAGGVDVHLGFECVSEFRRGGHGLYRIHTHKDRPGYLTRPRAGDLELTSDAETHAITWAFNPPEAVESGDDWRPTVLMDRVLEYLTAQAELLSRNAIARDVRGKKEYILQAIGYLLLEGKAAEVGPRRLITSANHSSPEPVQLEALN